ncbi:MAG: hypothetical protein OEY86_03340 [Nitrospira sp.]|nr:hypothetical protein [Nitrospira sp.]
MNIAGNRALVFYAKGETVRAFYERLDPITSPTDPLHLFIFLKDVPKVVS